MSFAVPWMLLWGVMACAGNGNEPRPSNAQQPGRDGAQPSRVTDTSSKGKPQDNNTGTPHATPLATLNGTESPPAILASGEDEMVPLTDVRRVEMDDRDDVPEDPAELKKRAKETVAAGNFDDALSMIDVLLVLNPEDAELIELRSTILAGQGLPEDAAADRIRCCQLGRPSCCP